MNFRIISWRCCGAFTSGQLTHFAAEASAPATTHSAHSIGLDLSESRRSSVDRAAAEM